MYSLLRVLASLSLLSLASLVGALIEHAKKATKNCRLTMTHCLRLARLMIFYVILLTLNGCATRSMIDTYCITYVPVRNYLEAPTTVIHQIDINNNRYLHKCMDSK